MKIGLNATCFNYRASGANQRFRGLYGEVIRRLSGAEFVIFEPADCRVGDWFAGAANVTVRRTPIPSIGRARKFAEGLRYWGKALACEQLDIFEVFNLPLVRAPTGQTIQTIHDVRRLSRDWPALERAVYKVVLGRALRGADHVVTVSESIATEIRDFFPLAPVSVIYNGLDSDFFQDVSSADILSVREKFSLPETFILAVGHLEARKNYLSLIEALAVLRDRGRPRPLVIVGNDNGLRGEIENKVRVKGLSEHVKILSGLSDDDVRAMYKLCSLLVFPSSYEGFGIPILEAMAASRPVVLSDIPAFREITEGKLEYFSPANPLEIAMAIDNVLSDDIIAQRLVDYGQQRVRDFGFAKLASDIERLYASLLASRRNLNKVSDES